MSKIESRHHGHNVDDCGNIWLGFHNGLSATLMYSGFQYGVTKVQVTLRGTKGILRIDGAKGAFLGTNDVWLELPGSVEENYLDRALEREWQEMVKALDEDHQPAISYKQGLHVMEVVDAIRLSSKLARPMHISASGKLISDGQKKI